METLKEIRKKMFLSQEELSVYLGISRSHLANIEEGVKTLPENTVERLTQLYVATQQSNRHLINTELVQQQNELAAFLQQNSSSNTVIKKRLQKKLTQMQEDYNTILQTLQTIRSIKNNLLPTHPKDILWCNAIEATLLEKLNTVGLIQQKKLEIKIELLG